MAFLPTTIAQTFPSHIQPVDLGRLLKETQGHEILLEQIVCQFEQRYGCSLEELEERLAQGKGQEHPNWEDSIEWRNAIESHQRTQLLRSILEWLVNSLAQSPSL